jgi:molybdopterin-synthase adenylyltransferase
MLNDEQRIRYERQLLFRPIAVVGQERLRASSVLIAGVGAIGCVAASILTRAGVGTIHLVDHDKVDLSNLQRQMLYDETDVASGRPKAELAAEKLGRVNSDIRVLPHVERFTSENGAALLDGVDLVIDAVDNFKAKFALNAACLEAGIPMVYGAVSGSFGITMPILPGDGACLCCLYCDEPDPGSSETAATAGVVAPIVFTIASLQCAQALKWLTGARDEMTLGVTQIDVWDGEFALLPVPRRAGCAACGELA